MSVPLDRLYNFLYNVCNRDDLIIYGFFPHGSRKLEDITVLQNIKNTSWTAGMTAPALIFHDQEPLKYIKKLKLYSRKNKRLCRHIP